MSGVLVPILVSLLITPLNVPKAGGFCAERRILGYRMGQEVSATLQRLHV
jgi:hypothetical protein